MVVLPLRRSTLGEEEKVRMEVPRAIIGQTREVAYLVFEVRRVSGS